MCHPRCGTPRRGSLDSLPGSPPHTTMRSLLDALVAALRGLRRSPRQAALTIGCIALGVAATGTAISLAWTVTVRPLPFPDADRLVRVWLANESDRRLDISIPDLLEVRDGISAFDAFGGTARTRITALFDEGAVRMRGEAVTEDYFAMMGVRAQVGRLLVTADHAPDAPRQVVLSATSWRRYFGASPGALGQLLRTEGEAFEVVGVMQDGFSGSIENDEVEFWIPLSHYVPAAAARSRFQRQSWAVARLAPGATLATARAQLASHDAVTRAAHPDPYRNMEFVAEPFGDNWRAGLRGSGMLLLAAALLLLVIAIVNVSTLALARTVDRRREFAVRVALGARTRQVALLPFAESAVAAAIGGLAGALAAPWLLAAFLDLAPIALPGYLRPEMQGVVLLLVAVTCMVAAMGSGALPALEARRIAPERVMREGGRGQVGGRHAGRAHRLLVGAQVALTTVLIVVASLLARSWQSLQGVSLGYDTRIARFAVTASAQDLGADPSAFRRRLRESLLGQAGVEGVAFTWPTMPPWNPYRTTFTHASLGDVTPEQGPRAGIHAIDEHFFGTMGMTLLSGRGIESHDVATSEPVVVISASLAERLGGARRVLGTTFVITDPDRVVPERARIVGVTADVAWDGVAEQRTGRMIRSGSAGASPSDRWDVFYSIPQVPASARQVSIAARIAGDVRGAIDPLSRVLSRAAPLSAVHWASAMEDEVAVEYRSATFALLLTLAFGGGALLLAGIGLFATLQHTVGKRIPEFGLRLALGASPARLRGQVLRAGLRLVLTGALVGGGVAVGASQLLRNLLFDVGPGDLTAYVISAVVLGAVALVACWLPARRAARVSALEAMRAD